MTNLRFAAATPISSLARAYEVAGNESEAKRINELLAGAGGVGGVEREMTLAQKELGEGRFAEAVRRLQPIASGGSWLSPLATMWVGVAEGQLGNREAGRQTILRGVDLYRKTGQPATDGLLSVGGIEFNRGNYADAATWYGLAVHETPREAGPNFLFARALEEQGKLTEAMAIYKRIASGELPLEGSTVTLFDVYLQMGSVEQKQGRLKDAIPYAEETLRRSPNPAKREEVRIWVESLRANAK
jgi:tetratricopeptide (TPR) repeat protein